MQAVPPANELISKRPAPGAAQRAGKTDIPAAVDVAITG